MQPYTVYIKHKVNAVLCSVSLSMQYWYHKVIVISGFRNMIYSTGKPCWDTPGSSTPCLCWNKVINAVFELDCLTCTSNAGESRQPEKTRHNNTLAIICGTLSMGAGSNVAGRKLNSSINDLWLFCFRNPLLFPQGKQRISNTVRLRFIVTTMICLFTARSLFHQSVSLLVSQSNLGPGFKL